MHRPTLYITLLLATVYVVSCAEENSGQHKRAPLGFTGVRGKKSIPDSAYSDSGDTGVSHGSDFNPLPPISLAGDLEAGVVKRAPAGFMGMRGKKPYPAAIWEGNYPDAQYKRAPSGFLGMRGKKDMEFTNYGEDLKRAPSGFMGMRGKKDYDNFDNYDTPAYYDKRTQMGFMGMRGKKDYDDSYYNNEDKRAPSSSGFFGMRGKKQPAGFFGMRGKKYPYEFRGKFVGVRGKKMSNEISAPDYYRNGLDDGDFRITREIQSGIGKL